MKKLHTPHCIRAHPQTGSFASAPVISEAIRGAKHPLETTKAKGWRLGEFIKLLSDHGFAIGGRSGGGHMFVMHSGNQVRASDGRPLILPAHSSGTELTPGVAKQVLKVCAMHLVAVGAA